MNNPLTYIDPTGMSAESVQDDYTFDENTGTFTLVPDTESDTDRVVTLNDDGTTDKVLEKGIAKGFIHPKRNFKTNHSPPLDILSVSYLVLTNDVASISVLPSYLFRRTACMFCSTISLPFLSLCIVSKPNPKLELSTLVSLDITS